MLQSLVPPDFISNPREKSYILLCPPLSTTPANRAPRQEGPGAKGPTCRAVEQWNTKGRHHDAGQSADAHSVRSFDRSRSATKTCAAVCADGASAVGTARCRSHRGRYRQRCASGQPWCRERAKRRPMVVDVGEVGTKRRADFRAARGRRSHTRPSARASASRRRPPCQGETSATGRQAFSARR